MSFTQGLVYIVLMIFLGSVETTSVLAQTTTAATGAPIAAEPTKYMAKGGEVRAQLSALQHTIISSELNARIANLSWREGQRVKAGQLLVRFDCRAFQAQLEQAKAKRKEAEATLNVQKRLSSLNATSALEEQLAEARLEQAQAEIYLHEVMVGRCEIVAPFPGRIGTITRQAQEVVAPGDRLLELVNDIELEVEMIVPSAGLKALHKGTLFSVQLDELTEPMQAEVDRTGGLIDPVSQSVRIFGRLINPPAGLLPGMSGQVHFELK